MSGQERKQIYINEYTSLFYTVLCNFPPFMCSPRTLDRPSKCQNFYINRFLVEQNLRKKMRTICHNLNCNKMPFLFKYALTVQFSI